MNARKGYYALIQFCPDSSRLEAINIGVLVFCPELQFLAARTVRSNQRAAKLIGRNQLDRLSLNSAKRSLERRLENERSAIVTLDDLQHFIDSRANVLKLTNPRPVKITDPEDALATLFDELVGGHAGRSISEPILPALDEKFQQLKLQGRARLNWDVAVPVVGRSLRIPYAYRNGIWNLVKPYRFSTQEGQALTAAMRLAIEGDLIYKHPEIDYGKKQLVIVYSFDEDSAAGKIEDRVQGILNEYNVTTVPDLRITDFIAKVEREAHA